MNDLAVPVNLKRIREHLGPNPPPALILGRPNANLLAQARALGRQGIPVYCLLNRGEPPFIARLCRYVNKVIVAQRASDDEIVNHIRELHDLAGCKPVLFYGGDYDITLTARIWPLIEPYVIAVTAPEQASELNDKSRQVSIVESAGIAVPATRVLRHLEDLEAMRGEMAFPVICRPVELARKGEFEGKIFVARSEAEFEHRLAPVLKSSRSDVLVQEYVPGGNDTLYFALAVCNESGEPEAMVTGRKLFEYPEGLMCVGETVQNPDLSAAARSAFQALGIGGVLGVEFKYDSERNRFFFIEANFRPENIIAIAEAAGVNIMLAAYLQAIEKRDLYSPVGAVSAIWRDVSLVVLSRLSGKYPQRMGSKCSLRVDAFWANDDPLPALAWYLVKVWRVVGGTLRR